LGTVRLITPQFVKPYLQSQKNDPNDAAAICEQVGRPHMRFVPQKTIEQQDLQALHRVRSRLIGCRTQLGNQIRGLLSEYGVELPNALSQVRKAVPQLLEDGEVRLTPSGKRLFASLYEELVALDERVAAIDLSISTTFQQNELCQRIAEIEGVGPITATAIVAAIANGSTFRNGRQFAAWLGLVPRQHSSGEKHKLLGNH
jgi:transposase